jgi:hypothetical protein
VRQRSAPSGTPIPSGPGPPARSGGTVLSALVFTIVVFEASVMFGFLMLVLGDPLFILIVLAIYRIILEFFVVTFRVAEDIRALRERAGLS